MLSGNRLLFPRRCGFTPPVFATAKGGGVVTGLVPLPRAHLLPSANDGSCFIPVGGKEPQQKLYACDGVQGRLKTLSPPSFLDVLVGILCNCHFWSEFSSSSSYVWVLILLTRLMLFDFCVSMFFLLTPRLFAVLLNAFFSVAITVTVTDFQPAVTEA